MIPYDLICGKDHVFEAWFKSRGVFSAQQAAGDIACPVCGSSQVFKAPHATSGTKYGQSGLSEAGEDQLARDLIQALERLCRHIDDSTDDPDEDSGRDTERRDCADEPVEVIQIPWIRRRHNS